MLTGPTGPAALRVQYIGPGFWAGCSTAMPSESPADRGLSRSLSDSEVVLGLTYLSGQCSRNNPDGLVYTVLSHLVLIDILHYSG